MDDSEKSKYSSVSLVLSIFNFVVVVFFVPHYLEIKNAWSLGTEVPPQLIARANEFTVLKQYINRLKSNKHGEHHSESLSTDDTRTNRLHLNG